MEDVQRHAPKVPINIDRVGIRGITVPLLVRDRAQGSRQTVAGWTLVWICPPRSRART